MTIGVAPIASQLPVTDDKLKRIGMASLSKPWANWFTEIFLSVFGWKRTYYGTLTNDFGSINTLSQATQTVTITGARSGDMVIVRPTTAVNGLFVDGTVTADDTVTVRVANYSSGSIDPASQVYNVLVIQQ